MMESDPKRIRSIFLAAVEDHAPDRWAGYLDSACRGEPELRQRVEVLLRAHRQPNELLDDPDAAPVVPPAKIGEGPGTVIGPYKLLEQIGEGGFGVVFMAEQQQPVRRMVALKIIKPGMDTRQVVARFEAERQALALMEHPHIARIFDGGATESGRPYFVMELVRGVPITEYCGRHRLDLRGRLELFVDVCQGVQHAHQKGVIHRDLKPSNVMVTRHDVTPVVKIIDFGIAKAAGQQLTDKTLFTNFGQMIGTPAYMSPEQAQLNGLDADTRSDVYSLGVLLYELLTGSTPFEKERLHTVAYNEMIRIIREEEPERPSTRVSTLGHAAKTATGDGHGTPERLSQQLRGELDWIVMKSLEKDRSRRYESPGALALEIQRYLQDEPVQACPPTFGYRLRKSARRHKAALATAAMVFVALSVGTAVAAWQAVAANRAKRDALDSAAAESRAKTAAEAKEAEAEAVISFLENRIIATARPEGMGAGLGYDVSLRRAIAAAVPFVQEGFKDQPLIEVRLRMMLGHSFASLGEVKKAGEQFFIARRMYGALHGPDHESTIHSAACLAASYNAETRFAEARQLCAELLPHARAKLGPEHWVTLKTMETLATSCDGLGRYSEALELREEAVDILTSSLGPEHRKTLQSRVELAVSYSHFDRNAEALEIEKHVLAVRKARLGDDHVETLEAMNNAAFTLLLLGRAEEARKMNEYILARRTEKLGVDHPNTLQSLSNLAVCFGRTGQWRRSLELHAQALELSRTKLGPDHTATLERMSDLATAHRHLGQWKDAAALCEEALRRHRDKRGPDYRSMLQTMHNLALCYEALGDLEKALELCADTVKRRSAALGPDHADTLWSMHNLGVYLFKMHRTAESLTWHRRTLDGRTVRLGAAHPDSFGSVMWVARCLMRLDRGAEAVTVIDGSVQLARKTENRQAQIVDLMSLRMEHYLNMKDVAGCRATAEMWDAVGRTDADGCYNSACAHAVVALAIRNQDPSALGGKQSDLEADLAMEWLRKAVAAGYRDAAHLVKDSDLDVLRKRPDFVRLLAELTESKSGMN